MIRLLSVMMVLFMSVAGHAVSVLDSGTYKEANGAVIPALMADHIKLVPPPLGDVLRVNVATDGTRFHVGDSLPIQFAVNKKSYVWIFNTDPNGRMVQVFPNYYDRNNCVEPGKTYGIPDRSYQVTVTGPRGTNKLEAVAVSLECDYAFLNEWLSYTLEDPYPATPTGAKGLMSHIDTMCRRPTSFQGSPQVQYPLPEKDLYALKTQTYYVMERVGGETVLYRVPRYGKLAVNSYPTNGRIYMDGLYVGRTPQVVERVPAGEHKIKVMKEGYTPYECTVTVETNNFAQVDAFLKETPVEPGYSKRSFKKIELGCIDFCN